MKSNDYDHIYWKWKNHIAQKWTDWTPVYSGKQAKQTLAIEIWIFQIRKTLNNKLNNQLQYQIIQTMILSMAADVQYF